MVQYRPTGVAEQWPIGGVGGGVIDLKCRFGGAVAVVGCVVVNGVSFRLPVCR